MMEEAQGGQEVGKKDVEMTLNVFRVDLDFDLKEKKKKKDREEERVESLQVLLGNREEVLETLLWPEKQLHFVNFPVFFLF